MNNDVIKHLPLNKALNKTLTKKLIVDLLQNGPVNG
jgi:hypothetical protein